MTATPSTPSLIRRFAAVSAVSIMLSCGGGSAATDASALALLGLPSTTSSTNQSTQSISAYLADSEGAPVANTTVNFAQAGVRSARVNTATTDSDGLFSVLLAPQTYNATAGNLTFELVVYSDGTVESGTAGVFVGRDRRNPPLRLIVDGDRAVDEGQDAELQVRLKYRPKGAVKFDVSVVRATDGTAGFHVSPQELTFQPSRYDEPQTITVSSTADGKAFDRTVEILLDPRRGNSVTTYALFYDTDAPMLVDYDIDPSGMAVAAIDGTSSGVLTTASVDAKVIGRGYRQIIGGLVDPGSIGVSCPASLVGSCDESVLAANTNLSSSSHWNAQDATYDSLTNRVIFVEATHDGQYILNCEPDLSSCDAPVTLAGPDLNPTSYMSVDAIIDPLDNKLLVIVSGYHWLSYPDIGSAVLYRCETDGSQCSIRSLPVNHPMEIHPVLDEKERRLLVQLSISQTDDTLACTATGSQCVLRSRNSVVPGTNRFAALDRKNDRYISARSYREHPAYEYRSVIANCDRDATNCSEVVSAPMQGANHLREMTYAPQADRLFFAGYQAPGNPAPNPGNTIYSCKGDGTDCVTHVLNAPGGGGFGVLMSPLYVPQENALFVYGRSIYTGTDSNAYILRVPLVHTP